MTAEPMVEMTSEEEFLDSLKALNTDRLFVHVELERLKIDPRYQRTVKMQRVRNMAANYNPDLMGVLVCSVRPDGVFVVDGQHRLEVARLLGHKTVRCELRIGLTVEQEAGIFYNLDTQRVGLSSADAFRALLMSEDPAAVALNQAITDAGLIAVNEPLPNAVRSYKTLLKLAKTRGMDNIRKVLKVCHDAWADTVNAAPAAVIEGLSLFITLYPEVSMKELARAVGAHTTTRKLSIEARALSKSMSWNTGASMGRAILAAYNFARPAAFRLEDRF